MRRADISSYDIGDCMAALLLATAGWRHWASWLVMKSNDLIMYDCAKLAVEHLVDCAAGLSAAQSNPIRLLLAAKSAHSALASSLTAALTQSNFSGALTERAEKKLTIVPLREYQTTDRKAPDFLDLEVDSLKGLLKKARDMGLIVTPDPDELIDKLTYIRHQIEHPKAKGAWSFTVAYCLSPIRKAVEISMHLIAGIEDLPAHEHQRATVAAKAIEKAFQETSSIECIS